MGRGRKKFPRGQASIRTRVGGVNAALCTRESGSVGPGLVVIALNGSCRYPVSAQRPLAARKTNRLICSIAVTVFPGVAQKSNPSALFICYLSTRSVPSKNRRHYHVSTRSQPECTPSSCFNPSRTRAFSHCASVDASTVATRRRLPRPQGEKLRCTTGTAGSLPQN